MEDVHWLFSKEYSNILHTILKEKIGQNVQYNIISYNECVNS